MNRTIVSFEAQDIGTYDNVDIQVSTKVLKYMKSVAIVPNSLHSNIY